MAKLEAELRGKTKSTNKQDKAVWNTSRTNFADYLTITSIIVLDKNTICITNNDCSTKGKVKAGQHG